MAFDLGRAAREFAKKAINRIKPITEARFRRIANKAFEETLKFVAGRIASHPVSKDISSHSQSRFLKGVNGTLFGFMGFEAGFDPIGYLIETVVSEAIVVVRRNAIGVGFNGYIRFPGPEQLRKRDGMLLPWQSGKSWPELIEDGDFSNLAYFLPKITENSRSQEGLQASHEIWKGSPEFEAQPYLSQIFAEAKEFFRENLRIQRATV